MNKNFFILMSILLLCCVTINAMKENKKITITKELSGISNDPHRNVTPTSPRTFQAWIAQNSPRSRQNDKEKPEVDTTWNRCLYYCLCVPLWYSWCQPKQYEDV